MSFIVFYPKIIEYDFKKMIEFNHMVNLQNNVLIIKICTVYIGSAWL